MSDYKFKTLNIKGKEYVQVNERIKYFRANKKYDKWIMVTEILSHENGKVLMRTDIKDPQDRVMATGFAQEKESDGFINKTSYIENCESSSWGRALGNLGIGIDTSIASSEEMQNAMLNQNNSSDKEGVKTSESDILKNTMIKTISSIQSSDKLIEYAKELSVQKKKLNKVQLQEVYDKYNLQLKEIKTKETKTKEIKTKESEEKLKSK